MGNIQKISYVLPTLKYKSAPTRDVEIPFYLEQNTKLNVEFDRTADVDLQQLFDDERQASTIFRPAAKFSILFKNSYAGITNYVPFENNLYYVNALQSAIAQCTLGANAVSWSGLPLYNEFDFIRTDYDVTGYTQPPNQHLIFTPQSASTYNWNFFMSYGYENDFSKTLQAIDKKTSTTLQWVVGDGIPFIIEKIQISGRDYISFRCPVNHGLQVGEFVELTINYNGENIFKVDALGDGFFGTDEYIFNLDDVGYTGVTFSNGVTGTFRRIILDSNSADTKSLYYVKRHKLLTNVDNAVMAKAGFEQNVFGISKKYESSGLTPNYTARVSIKEGAQSYSLSFNKDIDLKNELDNLGRPITELFFTVVWSGYFGWTSGNLKFGYEFNLPESLTAGQPSAWWDINNTLSDSNITISTWTNGLNTFNYVSPLQSGDIIDGEICEFNYFEQKERVISESYHKIVFNPAYFNTTGNIIPTNPFGYYYQPHHKLKIREYSTYIEEAEPENVIGIPNYSYYSTTLNQFIWRDIYSYGFIETTTNSGVNYPFLNGGHYPFGNYVFRIIPEGTNLENPLIVSEPIVDGCE